MAKEEKIRAGMHKGTAGKKGAYSPKHNDRNFTSSPDHIDKSLSKNNLYWDYLNGFSHTMTFDEVERHFYESHFQSALDAINSRYIKNGDRRVQSGRQGRQERSRGDHLVSRRRGQSL